jgi:hypothetical protein
MNKGYKTTEFWLSLAAVLIGALAAAGVFPEGSMWMKVLGVGAVVLGSMGYSVSRGLAKQGTAGPTLGDQAADLAKKTPEVKP